MCNLKQNKWELYNPSGFNCQQAGNRQVINNDAWLCVCLCVWGNQGSLDTEHHFCLCQCPGARYAIAIHKGQREDTANRGSAVNKYTPMFLCCVCKSGSVCMCPWTINLWNHPASIRSSAEAVAWGRGKIGFVGACGFLRPCVSMWTENGFLHCRCNNLRHEGAGGREGGSSITISFPPSVSLAAK